TFIGQQIFHVSAEIGVVIEQRDFDYSATFTRDTTTHWFPSNRFPSNPAGSRTSNRAPPSLRFDAVIDPSCCLTIPSETVNPRPVPFASNRVVTKASKISGSTSGGIPGPSSSTRTTTQRRPRSTRTSDDTSIAPSEPIAFNEFLSRLTNTCIRRSISP